MKLSEKLDDEIAEALQSEHEKALVKLLHNKTFSNILPMHTSNMNIIVDEGTGESEIRSIIVPDIAIYINKNSISEKGIDRSQIDYRIAYNHAPYPIAHVYSDSGYLCLGSIFVPSYVPLHSPQQPLETLFLHNDRNENHGNPHINMSKTKIKKITEILSLYMSAAAIQMMPLTMYTSNWVKNDTLWHLSAYILEQFPKAQAFDIMTQIYNIVFPQQETQETEKSK